MRSLVLVGQGSLENSEAAQRIAALAQQARAAGLFSEVLTAYLLEEPSLRQALRVCTYTDVTIVPVVPRFDPVQLRLIHTIFPRELGLGPQGEVPPEGVACILGGKSVRYLPAILEGEPLLLPTITATGGIQRQRRAAWEELTALTTQKLRFGEVVLRAWAGLVELRHMLDDEREVAELRTLVTLDGLRAVASYAPDGSYRPVRTWRNLARGWRAVFSEAELPAALSQLYPAATEEAYAYGCHQLHSTPWPTTLRRIGLNDDPATAQAVARMYCGLCLRSRLWAGESPQQTVFQGVPGGLVCPEACPPFVAEFTLSSGQWSGPMVAPVTVPET